MQQEPANRPSWVRLANLGFELAAAIGGFVLVGWWVDRHWGTSPRGVLVGALLGLVGGMYNLIKASLTAASEARREDHDRESRS